MNQSASDLVTLKNGPVVRASACELACVLEAKGHAMSASDGQLRVTNGAKLTADDRAAIVRDKAHLVSICEYIASGAADAS